MKGNKKRKEKGKLNNGLSLQYDPRNRSVTAVVIALLVSHEL